MILAVWPLYESKRRSPLGRHSQGEQLSKVPNSAWNGENSVTFQGNTYLVADDVACYIAAADKWVTVSQARAFSDTADLYYDSIGEKIRIVVVSN